MALAAELRTRSSKQIIIDIAPHTYVGSYAPAPGGETGIERLPLAIVENTWLRGATRLATDSDGLPTGEIVPGTDTLIRPDAPLGLGQAVVWIAKDDVRVSGLVLDGAAAAPGSRGIIAERVRGLAIERNVIKRFGEGLATRLSSGAVRGNYVTDTSFGLVFEGGPVVDDVSLLVTLNRSERNTAGSGIFGAPDVDRIDLGGGEQSVPIDATDVSRISIRYRENDFRMNATAGVRLLAFAGAAHPLQQRSEIHVSATRNRFDCNGAYGFIVDTISPLGPGADLSADIDADFEGNQLVGNGRAALMLSFIRFQQAILQPPVVQPLEHSTFIVTGDLSLSEVDMWHLETSNSLVFDGVTAPFGRIVSPAQPTFCPTSNALRSIGR